MLTGLRNIEGRRQLTRLAWGMPTPLEYLKSPKAPDMRVTNMRNTTSPWRKWPGIRERWLYLAVMPSVRARWRSGCSSQSSP
ncbi:hypothetical protein [Paracoccus haematequi]|uniref:hypothetical protein n=1 Tax=Paracoccus haematequi TaxID=2491866 RepID=UPI000F7E3373|nr:hypothetical protein [Paracoccus haematequi]